MTASAVAVLWSAGSYAVPPVGLLGREHGATTGFGHDVAAQVSADELADPEARVELQRRDGLTGEVLHPHPELVDRARRADGASELDVARAYNEWIAGFVAAAPERFAGVGHIPTTGLDDALTTLRQCQELGLAGISLVDQPAGPGTTPADGEPFWAEAHDRTVVCIGPAFGGASVDATPTITAGRPPAVSGFLTRLAFSGIIDSYPQTRILLVNHEAGWLPYVLEGADTNYMRTAASRAITLGDPDALPSEYVRRVTWATIHEDRFSAVHRAFLGEAHLMYSAAVPSSASDWPDDEQQAARICEGLPSDARIRLLADNCRRLFSIGEASPFTREEVEMFQHPVVA